MPKHLTINDSYLFALASHEHPISEVNGLQTALNSKQGLLPTGTALQYLKGDLTLGTFPTSLSSFLNDSNYITISALTWANITGKPSTFTPSAHTHSISEISGLTTELAGKQPVITTGTGLQYFKGDLTLGTFPTALSQFTNDLGQWVTSGNNLYFTAGNVSIGTSTAGEKLLVAGNINISNGGGAYLRNGELDMIWNGATSSATSFKFLPNTGNKDIYMQLFPSGTSSLTAFELYDHPTDISGRVTISNTAQAAKIGFTNNFSGLKYLAFTTGQNVEQMVIRRDGTVSLTSLMTVSSAPSTVGATKMVITDANGKLSFADVPTGGDGVGVQSVGMTTNGTGVNVTTSDPYSNPVINFNFSGTTAQYLRGDGSLATMPLSSGSARFGYAGEDVTAISVRNFDAAGYAFNISNASTLSLKANNVNFESTGTYNVSTVVNDVNTYFNGSILLRSSRLDDLSSNAEIDISAIGGIGISGTQLYLDVLDSGNITLDGTIKLPKLSTGFGNAAKMLVVDEDGYVGSQVIPSGGGGGGMTDFHWIGENTSSQYVSDYGPTPLNLNQVTQGATSWNWTGTQGTVPATGIYQVSIMFRFQDGGDNFLNGGAYLSINGATKLLGATVQTGISGLANRRSYTWSAAYPLTSGDIVKAICFCDGPGRNVVESLVSFIRVR